MADTTNATILWRHLLVPLNHFSVAKIRRISGTAKLFGNYFCYQRPFASHLPLFPKRQFIIFHANDTTRHNTQPRLSGGDESPAGRMCGPLRDGPAVPVQGDDGRRGVRLAEGRRKG